MAIPSRRERHKARRKQRRHRKPGERVLRGVIVAVVVLLVAVGAGYGYFRFEWSKVVSNPSDITKELADLRKAGKHTVLMRVKSGNGTRFVAIPFGNA